MDEFARIPLEDGGAITFESVPDVGGDGPLKAGRGVDAVRELPQELNEFLAPVGETARTLLTQLRQAGPDEVEVEFSVSLSAKAGAVITQGTASGNLKVKMTWKNEDGKASDDVGQ